MKAFITKGNAVLKSKGIQKLLPPPLVQQELTVRIKDRKLETCSYAKAFYGHRENSGGCGQATAGINSI